MATVIEKSLIVTGVPAGASGDKNLVHPEKLVISQNGVLQPSDWNQFAEKIQGNSVDNLIVASLNPFGELSKMWRCMSGGSQQGSSGFESLSPNMRTDETYRFSCFVKFTSAGGDGSIYLGTSQGNYVEYLNGNVETNPYFYHARKSTLMVNKWYLLVGYVYPKGYNGVDYINNSGVYDVATGDRVVIGQDFRFLSSLGSETNLSLRAYQYYSYQPNHPLYFYDAMIHKCDGTEPSLNTIMGVDINKNYLTEAFKESTTIDGGIISTSLIKVGATDTGGTWVENAGINGVRINGGSDVRFWSGGTFEQANSGEATFIIYESGDVVMKSMRSGTTGKRVEISNNSISLYSVILNEDIKVISLNGGQAGAIQCSDSLRNSSYGSGNFLLQSTIPGATASFKVVTGVQPIGSPSLLVEMEGLPKALNEYVTGNRVWNNNGFLCIGTSNGAVWSNGNFLQTATREYTTSNPILNVDTIPISNNGAGLTRGSIYRVSSTDKTLMIAL